jgi:hypothetical protein
VRFRPTALGAQSGQLALAGFTVPLTGNGITPPPVPSITVSPSSLTFGTVTVGQTQTLTLAVGNTGTADLRVTGASIAGGAFTVVSPTVPFTVAASGQTTLSIRFAPSAAGAATSTLALTSNDPARGTVNVPLSGTGAAATAPTTAPVIAVTPASLDFGAVTTGQSRDSSLTVRNTGNASLSVTAISSSNPVFTIPGAATFTIAAGGQAGRLPSLSALPRRLPARSPAA